MSNILRSAWALGNPLVGGPLVTMINMPGGVLSRIGDGAEITELRRQLARVTDEANALYRALDDTADLLSDMSVTINAQSDLGKGLQNLSVNAEKVSNEAIQDLTTIIEFMDDRIKTAESGISESSAELNSLSNELNNIPNNYGGATGSVTPISEVASTPEPSNQYTNQVVNSAPEVYHQETYQPEVNQYALESLPEEAVVAIEQTYQPEIIPQDVIQPIPQTAQYNEEGNSAFLNQAIEPMSNQQAMRAIPMSGSGVDLSSQIPNGDTSFHSWMGYNSITSRRSGQFKLQQDPGTFTDSYGLRRHRNPHNPEGDVIVALGSGFGERIGTRFRVTMDDGNQFYAMLGDVKNPRDATAVRNSAGQSVGHQKGGGRISVLEFVVDRNQLDPRARRMGNVGAIGNGFSGNVRNIERLGVYGDFVWG